MVTASSTLEDPTVGILEGTEEQRQEEATTENIREIDQETQARIDELLAINKDLKLFTSMNVDPETTDQAILLQILETIETIKKNMMYDRDED